MPIINYFNYLFNASNVTIMQSQRNVFFTCNFFFFFFFMTIHHLYIIIIIYFFDLKTKTFNANNKSHSEKLALFCFILILFYEHIDTYFCIIFNVLE